jgi:uncharacterized membrane protein
MRPNEIAVMVGCIVAAMILWLVAWRISRGRLRSIALVPGAICSVFVLYILTWDEYRNHFNFLLWCGTVGVGVGIICWDFGLTTWVKRKTPLAIRQQLNRRGPLYGVSAFAIFSAAISGWIVRFLNSLLQDFHVFIFDFSNLHQSMWTLANLGTPRTTVMNYRPLEQFGYHWWAEHFTPIQYVLLPFYYFFQEPETLHVLHGVFCGLSFVALAFAAHAWLKNWAAAILISFVYASTPLTVTAITNGFHYESFSPLFFFLAFYCYAHRRPAGFVICLLISFTSKESMPIGALAWGGATVLFHTGRRKWGLLICATAIAYYILAMKGVVHFIRNGQDFEVVTTRYNWIFVDRGISQIESTGHLVKLALQYPQDIFGALLNNRRWESMVQLTFPFALLFFLRPWTICIYAPTACMHMLTDFHPQFMFQIYHAIEVMPLLIIALLIALEKPLGIMKPIRRNRLVACSMIALMIAHYGAHKAKSYYPTGGMYPRLPPVLWRYREWSPHLYHTARNIPQDIAIASYGNLQPVLADRVHLYNIGDKHDWHRVTDMLMTKQHWVESVVNHDGPMAQLKEYAIELAASGEWGLVVPYDSEKGVFWIRRGLGPIENWREIVSDLFSVDELELRYIKQYTEDVGDDELFDTKQNLIDQLRNVSIDAVVQDTVTTPTAE